MSSSRSLKSSTTSASVVSSSQAGPSGPVSKPAFHGAKFDKDGCCIYHIKIQLAEQVKQDGRLLWKEIRMNCPKCQSEHHKSRRVTSLGGAGKVKKGRTVHGMNNPLRDSLKSGRHMDKEFSTPFDDNGRCHHHPNVQMATKKVRGGWKILMSACPKCIEAQYDEDVESVRSGSVASSHASSRRSKGSKGGKGGGGMSKLDQRISGGRVGGGAGSGGGDDDASMSSKSTKRSVTSRTTPLSGSNGRYDKNGCCPKHPHMQVAKKKLLGGWKELRECPKCLDPDYDDMNETASQSSRRSNSSRLSGRSNSSRRSAKSVRSNSSRRGGTKTSRYAALPFDDEGYCHAHPSVRLAKKKALGGWKVIYDICPDCATDAGSRCSSRASSKKSGTGRYFDPSDTNDGGAAASDVTSNSGKSGRSNRSGGRRKKIRVKDMKFVDENGREGRYSGDVDDDHKPNGEGKMKYKDGTTWVGVWSEGSQVHGKSGGKSKSGSSSTGKSSPSSSALVESTKSGSKKSNKSDWARREERSAEKKTVRKMKWMDYYGDPGEYTGEVDGQNMPHGKGSMKYDHGLVQEGLWNKGQFIDGSDVDGGGLEGNGDGGGSEQKSGQRSSQQTPPRSRSSRKQSSSAKLSSSSRRDP